MNRALMNLHIEERIHPGSLERYKLAREREPGGAHAEVLRDEAIRVRGVLQSMERLMFKLSPEQRERLFLARKEEPPPGEDQCALAFYYLFHPGQLSLDVEEALAQYYELWGVLN